MPGKASDGSKEVTSARYACGHVREESTMVTFRNSFVRNHHSESAWLKDNIVLGASLSLLLLALASSAVAILVVS